VNTPQVLVPPEIIPSRISLRLSLGTQQCECARIGEKKQFTAIESEHVGQRSYSLIGGMAFVGFQVADVWRRCLDATGSIRLGEVELPSTFPNDLSETALSGACHRFYSPCLVFHSQPTQTKLDCANSSVQSIGVDETLKKLFEKLFDSRWILVDDQATRMVRQNYGGFLAAHRANIEHMFRID
jgi:hypothetical protein